MGGAIEGKEVVELVKQALELPWLTRTGGVALPFPLESLSKTTTPVPGGIAT